MSWTTSGDYLNLSDKEKIISEIEDECQLSGETCLSLKRLKIVELKKLQSEIRGALDKAYNDGQDDVTERLKKLDI